MGLLVPREEVGEEASVGEYGRHDLGRATLGESEMSALCVG